jgi:hypothetical protein
MLKRIRTETKLPRTIKLEHPQVSFKIISLYGIPIDANNLHKRLQEIDHLQFNAVFQRQWKDKFALANAGNPNAIREVKEVEIAHTHPHPHHEEGQSWYEMSEEEKEVESESIKSSLNDILETLGAPNFFSIYSKIKNAFLIYHQPDFETETLNMSDDGEDWADVDRLPMPDDTFFLKLHVLGQLLKVPRLAVSIPIVETEKFMY